MNLLEFNLLNQFGFILRLVSQRYEAALTEILTQDAKRGTLAVLATLEHGDYREADLIALTRTDEEIINGFIARGVVERVTVGDDTVLRLTEAARSQGHSYTEAFAAIAEKVLAPLTRYERHVLMELLRKLI